MQPLNSDKSFTALPTFLRADHRNTLTHTAVPLRFCPLISNKDVLLRILQENNPQRNLEKKLNSRSVVVRSNSATIFTARGKKIIEL
jgi:hypothetical protein